MPYLYITPAVSNLDILRPRALVESVADMSTFEAIADWLNDAREAIICLERVIDNIPRRETEATALMAAQERVHKRKTFWKRCSSSPSGWREYEEWKELTERRKGECAVLLEDLRCWVLRFPESPAARDLTVETLRLRRKVLLRLRSHDQYVQGVRSEMAIDALFESDSSAGSGSAISRFGTAQSWEETEAELARIETDIAWLEGIE